MNTNNVIVLPVHNQEIALLNRIEYLSDRYEDDTLLVIDDGSDDSLQSLIETSQRIHYLRHEKYLGYGGVVISAIEYAVAHHCDIIYFLDITNDGFHDVLEHLMDNIEYYDLLTCSRFSRDDHSDDYASMHAGRVVSHYLRDATGLSFTDFFSPFMALRTNAVSDFVLEEFDEAIFIQLWVQSVYYTIRKAELYCQKAFAPDGFRETLEKDDDYYINFVKGELLLYPLQG